MLQLERSLQHERSLLKSWESAGAGLLHKGPSINDVIKKLTISNPLATLPTPPPPWLIFMCSQNPEKSKKWTSPFPPKGASKHVVMKTRFLTPPLRHYLVFRRSLSDDVLYGRSPRARLGKKMLDLFQELDWGSSQLLQVLAAPEKLTSSPDLFHAE